MLHTLKEIVFVNAYWASIGFIGFGLILLIRDVLCRRYRSLLRATDFVLERPLITKFFMSFAFAASIMAIGALPCYVFGLPVMSFVVLYILLGLLGIGYLAIVFARNIFSVHFFDIIKLSGKSWPTEIMLILLGSILIADFSLALYAKSHLALSSDSYVHLSRIVAILSEGFTVNSGFFSSIPESGYHMNLIYALYTVPAKLFGLQPSHIWEYSFGFFRFMQWAAIFTLAWHATAYWFGEKRNALLGASVITIFALGFFSSNFFIATYPNQIALTWLSLFVVVLSAFERNSKGMHMPLILTALLITTTHPTYALMSSMFVALIFIIRFIQYKRGWLECALAARTYLALFLVLLIGPLRTALFPNRMTDAGFHIDDFPTWSLGPLSMKRPESLIDGPWLYAALIILASIGLVYTVYRVRNNRSQRNIVITLALFFPLLVYVPFAFTLLNTVLPMWAISRFAAMNVLTLITIPVGIFAVIKIFSDLVIRRTKVRLNKQAVYATSITIVLCLSGYSLLFMRDSITKYHAENEHYYAFMDLTYSNMHTVLKDNAVVVANAGDSYFLASVLPIDVIAIEEGHTTPSADVASRITCSKALMKYLNYSDLKAVEADYVVLSVYSPGYYAAKKDAEKLPFLSPVAFDSNFSVYKFDSHKFPALVESPTKACIEFKKVEQ